MSKQLLLGDEAIAQAALDAGLSGVYAYPGTPSTEITEYIQMAPITAEKNIHNRWCSNEKTAMEAALGMSFAGKRSLVCMKHVGMNVAADCFINSAITGVKGGLIIIAADDPSMHSSQNEQDSRFYGDFSLIPMYEPSNQQEAYDMVYNGFNFSEQTGEPILMRMVTRLAHSRSGVERKEQQPQNEISFSEDPRQFILLPGNARKRYKALQPFVEKQLKGYLGIGIKVKGRLDGTLSQDGELNPDSVARAVGKENKAEFSVPSLVEMRPPALCEGCGHRDMYTVLTQVLKEEYPTYKVFSDIGCYTLGANAHGEGCFRCRPASCRSRHRRLHLHPLGHDGTAGLRQRKRRRHHRHLRQRNHRHDRRTRFCRHRTSGSHLRRHRCSSRTHPRRSALEEKLRRDEANHPGRNRAPRRIRHHPPQRMYPNISTQKKKQVKP